MAADISHCVKCLVACYRGPRWWLTAVVIDITIWLRKLRKTGLLTFVVLILYSGSSLIRLIQASLMNSATLTRGIWISKIVFNCTVFHSILILPLACLLCLAIDIVLPKLIVAAAPFEPLKKILAVYVLNDRPLYYTGETLEYSAACASRCFVDVDYCLRLTYIVTFNASCLLRTRLLAWHVAAPLCTVLGRGVRMFCRNLIEVSLMERLHVQVVD